MDFIEDIPQKFHQTVVFLIQDENLDVPTKLSMLERLHLKESVIQRVADYLNPRPVETAKKKEVDFRDFLSEPCRTMVNMLIQQKRWSVLRQYMNPESPQVQEAFEVFMRRIDENHGRVQQEPEEVSVEADHPAVQGEKQEKGESVFKTSIPSEPPLVDRAPPPSSFSVHQNSLNSHEKNDSLDTSMTKDLQNFLFVDDTSQQQKEKQIEADKLAEFEKEVERRVAKRLEEEKQERLADEQREAENAARKKMEEQLQADKLQKELADAEAKRQKEAERVEEERRQAEIQAEEDAAFYSDDEITCKQENPVPKMEPKVLNAKVSAQFIQDFPKEINILVLGETGVGKSTWINASVNYFKYGTMDQARGNGVEVLIPTKFTQMDRDLRKTVVEYNSTIAGPKGQKTNEDSTTGESSTQFPRAYDFTWGLEKDQKVIRIIDTPGIGDKRGIEQDKVNFDNILRYIADYPEIHAILILLKPNNARCNLVFRFCILELLAHLHVSARKNIMFCFTNARSTFYEPGESLPAIDKLMQELEAKRGFRIPLEQNNTFCFDSESFRFLCCWGRGIQFSDSQKADFAQSWEISVNETFRLLHSIKNLQPHKVQATLSVNNVRATVFTLSKPIGELWRNIERNRATLKKKLQEVKALLKEKGNLAQLDLYVDQNIIHAKELPHPMTVCAAASCIEMRKFSNRPEEIEQTVYKKKCHRKCKLSGVKKGIFPNELIKDCACFGCGSHPDRCRECNCDWKTHLHIYYELVHTSERVMNIQVKQSLENNESKQKAAELFVLTEGKKLRDLEALSNKLRDYCSEFAAFIHSNSMLPYNDVYLEYLDLLIREEDTRISNGASDHMRIRLIDHRRIYEQSVEHLRDAAANPNQRPSKTTAEITSMLEEIKNLPNDGQFLRDVLRLELLSVRNEQTNLVTSINLKNSHFNNGM